MRHTNTSMSYGGHAAGAALSLSGLLAAPVSLLTSARVKRLLLAVVLLDVPIQAVKHVFIQEDAAYLGSIGGLQISLSTIALIFLYCEWLLRRSLQVQGAAAKGNVALPRPEKKSVTVPALLLTTFYGFSLLVADNPTLAAFELWNLVQLILLYVYMAHVVQGPDDISFVLRFLVIGLSFESLFMLAQAAGVLPCQASLGGLNKIPSEAYMLESRIAGTAGSPNPAAGYLAMVMTLALAVLVTPGNRMNRYLSGIGLALGVVPLLLTMSRGGWLCFAAGFSMLVLFDPRHRRFKLITVAILFAFIVLSPFADQIWQRVSEEDDGAAASRIPLNGIALLMIQDHFLTGVGANNFPVAMAPYAARCCLGQFLYTVHNQYLLVMAEVGAGGLIAFVCFLGAVVRTGLRCWRRRDTIYSPVALGCTAAVAGLIVHMFVDVFRVGASVHLLWIIAGLVTAMDRLNARDGHEVSITAGRNEGFRGMEAV
jgi:O-antigen ligase